MKRQSDTTLTKEEEAAMMQKNNGSTINSEISNNSKNVESPSAENQEALSPLKMYSLLKANDFKLKPQYCLKETKFHPEKQFLASLEKITKFKLISPLEVVYKYSYDSFHDSSYEPDKCSICQFICYDDTDQPSIDFPYESYLSYSFNDYIAVTPDLVLLEKCSDHFFHIECLKMLIDNKSSFKCPNCSTIYGILIGTQPQGTMTAYATTAFDCEGYPKVGTIIINYSFPHGKGYSGTARESYLPNNKEGKEILALFKVAFDRKLTFVVGTSVTTGKTNTTVWNGIHHKSGITGGPQFFGYPDPTYFNRVKQELAAKGVSPDSISEDLMTIANKLLKI